MGTRVVGHEASGHIYSSTNHGVLVSVGVANHTTEGAAASDTC